MEINTIEISGFASAFEALRLPYGKECRSIFHDKCLNFTETPDFRKIHYKIGIFINEKDFKLMQSLIKRGDEHAKIMRGIIVYAKVQMPIYMWCELETYICGHQRLCSESTMHIDCKGLVGEELQKAKNKISMGKELTKIDFFSYQCLRNIYKQRKEHRLPEWKLFIDWIKTLPFAEELIICE